MVHERVTRGLSRALKAYWRWFGFAGIPFGVFLLLIVLGSIAEGFDDLRFAIQSPEQHLQLALQACGRPDAGDSTGCPAPFEAKRQLDAIPTNSKEHAQAANLLSAIEAKIDRGKQEAKKLAYAQFQSNVSGDAHDAFTCANSTENAPIVSFDGGQNWWKDDGRCAGRLQRKKDSDAQISSYISTTLRVDTDMNSSWLADEERTCQTYPNDKGKVATVKCDGFESHTNHNIPVKFWGGVDRNMVSEWKCRREKSLLSDEFVCRAIN